MGDHTVVISSHYDNLLADPTKLAACPAKRTPRPIKGDGSKSNWRSPRYLIPTQPLSLGCEARYHCLFHWTLRWKHSADNGINCS
ncbi:hypothetical protein TNCT_69161 [Trichonephila clavata]|uniref:Uncharacterized protein n=1 Tax=Trichonephila clavata TaxID=2740835 RepID=A0A8X6GQU4_TRICU|nr:hypothetical protein TNCT_69161 [Trichonephila clavata]